MFSALQNVFGISFRTNTQPPIDNLSSKDVDNIIEAHFKPLTDELKKNNDAVKESRRRLEEYTAETMKKLDELMKEDL